MISAQTTIAAVIGDPVAHSLSPAIHNAAFDAAGLDWAFVAFSVGPGRGASAVEAMRALAIGGMSVTMPHKDAVAAAADECADAVVALGAANCLVPLGDGRVQAENTDGAGFLAGLGDDAGVEVDGRVVAILGGGGAARAVAHACGGAGASSVLVVNRSPDRADATAALAGPVGRVAAAAELVEADIVVNATPVGMGTDLSMPCDPGLLRDGQIVVDLVYNPAETEWLRAAREAGVETHNGLSMLVHQAALAFTFWTGAEAPIDAMRAAAENNLA